MVVLAGTRTRSVACGAMQGISDQAASVASVPALFTLALRAGLAPRFGFAFDRDGRGFLSDSRRDHWRSVTDSFTSSDLVLIVISSIFTAVWPSFIVRLTFVSDIFRLLMGIAVLGVTFNDRVPPRLTLHVIKIEATVPVRLLGVTKPLLQR